jgi:hypothetical protein
MLIKTNLVYLAEDYGITDYEGFSDYLFANFRDYVWRVYDGVEYCHANDAKWLAEEYLEYKSEVLRFW